jgi:hypothetical protein
MFASVARALPRVLARCDAAVAAHAGDAGSTELLETIGCVLHVSKHALQLLFFGYFTGK